MLPFLDRPAVIPVLAKRVVKGTTRSQRQLPGLSGGGRRPG